MEEEALTHKISDAIKYGVTIDLFFIKATETMSQSQLSQIHPSWLEHYYQAAFKTLMKLSLPERVNYLLTHKEFTQDFFIRCKNEDREKPNSRHEDILRWLSEAGKSENHAVNDLLSRLMKI